MTTLQFIIAGLATYRATILITKDLGPWRIFEHLRKLSPRWLGCPFCFSITVGALVSFTLFCARVETSPVICVLSVFAFSAISIILDRCFTFDHSPK